MSSIPLETMLLPFNVSKPCWYLVRAVCVILNQYFVEQIRSQIYLYVYKHNMCTSLFLNETKNSL